MRSIDVVDRRNGKVVLGINSLGEVVNNGFPYNFKQETMQCPEDIKDSECIDSYERFIFDVQSFKYIVQILRHDYRDPSLKDDELGYHLDIYPRPYRSFYDLQFEYEGLYFENPLPEELEFCQGGANRRSGQEKDEL